MKKRTELQRKHCYDILWYSFHLCALNFLPLPFKTGKAHQLSLRPSRVGPNSLCTQTAVWWRLCTVVVLSAMNSLLVMRLMLYDWVKSFPFSLFIILYM